MCSGRSEVSRPISREALMMHIIPAPCRALSLSTSRRAKAVKSHACALSSGCHGTCLIGTGHLFLLQDWGFEADLGGRRRSLQRRE